MHQKIEALQSEIRALRPSKPPMMPAVAIPSERSEQALFLFAELARQQLSVGRLDDARRTIADGLLVLDEITDESCVASGTVLLCELLLAVDAPQHAKPRLERALKSFERSTADGRWAVRARIALGRALVALDDIQGLAVLEQARRACVKLGEMTVVAQIDAVLRDAEKAFDTPRSVHTGYGRPVSTLPPADPIR